MHWVVCCRGIVVAPHAAAIRVGGARPPGRRGGPDAGTRGPPPAARPCHALILVLVLVHACVVVLLIANLGISELATSVPPCAPVIHRCRRRRRCRCCCRRCVARAVGLFGRCADHGRRPRRRYAGRSRSHFPRRAPPGPCPPDRRRGGDVRAREPHVTAAPSAASGGSSSRGAAAWTHRRRRSLRE